MNLMLSIVSLTFQTIRKIYSFSKHDSNVVNIFSNNRCFLKISQLKPIKSLIKPIYFQITDFVMKFLKLISMEPPIKHALFCADVVSNVLNVRLIEFLNRFY